MSRLFEYKVTWDTYRNKTSREWRWIFIAENAAAARKQFDKFWYEHEMKSDLRPRHPFHIKVKRIKPEKSEESKED